MLDSILHATVITAIIAIIGSFSAMAGTRSSTTAQTTPSVVQLPKVVVAVKRSQLPNPISATGG